MCAYILIIKAHAYLILARSTAILWVPRRYVLCKKKNQKLVEQPITSVYQSLLTFKKQASVCI